MRSPPRRAPDARVLADDGAQLAAWVDEPRGGPREGPREDQGPTVLLVHGWTLTAVAWDRVVGALRAEPGTAGARVVRYDQRGHGASRRGGSDPASIARLADDLLAVVDALAPTGPLVLVGHSMGGMALMAALRRHPHLLSPRTRGVVLVSTSAGGLRSAGRPFVPLMAALAHLPPGLSVPREPAVLAQRTVYGPGADLAVVAAVTHALGPVDARSTGEWFAALLLHDGADALDVLAEHGTPVDVVVGSADRLIPVAHAEAIAAAVPHARLQVVEDAGHMLLVERPDVVAEAVVGLLARPR